MAQSDTTEQGEGRNAKERKVRRVLGTMRTTTCSGNHGNDCIYLLRVQARKGIPRDGVGIKSRVERFDMILNIPAADAAAGAVRTVEEMKSENDEAIEKDVAIGMEKEKVDELLLG